jgi:glutamate-5-semialdehyde dehydrogenase
MTELERLGERLKAASRILSSETTARKNAALSAAADEIGAREAAILAANGEDVAAARSGGMKESLVDRLALNHDRIAGMIAGIGAVVELPDPVWRSSAAWTLENGLAVSKMTVPLGVIGIVYESRPNVTVDAFALALKSGNCIMLRGSSNALRSNRALVAAIRAGLEKSPIPADVVGFVDSEDRSLVTEMLGLRRYLDLIIPRGGRSLIESVVRDATVPTLETGTGNCHIFVDASADQEKALAIVENAKLQRPGTCNACETVLVHSRIAAEFLPKLQARIGSRCELRGCERTRAIIQAREAVEEDWETEYLDYILAIKVVDSLDEAIDHIARYGTMHTESILTEDYSNAQRFIRSVDAAAVYVNASTRFTDGGEYGFGAEMGISTQKLHARGPVGLAELVTVKYVGYGSGQIRD